MTEVKAGAQRGVFLLVVLVVVGAGVAAGITAESASDALVLLGISDPGPVTTYGLPVVRTLAEGAGMLTVGSLLLAVFLVAPQPNGVLDVDGYRAVRTAWKAALVWGGSAAVLVPLSLSDLSGRPLVEMLSPTALWNYAAEFSASTAWLVTAFLAVGLAVACRAALVWSWTPWLLGWAILALMPLGSTGHSSAGGAHDIATNSLILHLVSVSLWAGGLVALWLHARCGGAVDVAARRFSRVAGVALATVAVTGLINAGVRLPPSDLLFTGYGRLIVAKVAAIGVLGGIGLVHRRRSLPALAADPAATGPLARFAAVEAIVFAATVGIAVGLGRTPPPATAKQAPTAVEATLGYQLPQPPSVSGVLLEWRFDLVFGTLAVVAAAAYLVGVRRLRRRGIWWPWHRTAAWLLGWCAVLVATSSGIGRYGHAMFSMHLAEQVVLSILAPALAAVAAPFTLALQAISPAEPGTPPGPHEWVRSAMTSPPARALTSPIVAPLLFGAGLYGLYFSGLFGAILATHAAHLAMNLYFLATGYGLLWLLVGADPTPRPVGRGTRLVVTVAVTTAMAVYTVILAQLEDPIGGWFYGTLGLGWNDPARDQHSAAVAVGLAATAMLAIVAVTVMSRSRSAPRRRTEHTPGRATP